MSLFTEVWDATRLIPSGKVATYGQIAAFIGRPHASQAVGWALHSNPSPGEIPCHRVVNRFGEVCPGFAFGGAEIQRMLLENEGVVFNSEGKIDLSVYRAEL